MEIIHFEVRFSDFLPTGKALATEYDSKIVRHKYENYFRFMKVFS